MRQWFKFIFFSGSFFLASLSSQEISLKNLNFKEEFSWGVRAFNRGYRGKALQRFEKAFVLKSQDPLILEWLGKAYYFNGFDEEALSKWNYLLETGKGTVFIRNFVKTLESRDGILSLLNPQTSWTFIRKIPHRQNNFLIFNKPINIYPDNDLSGRTFVTSLLTNEVLVLNADTLVVKRYKGSLEKPLAGPYGITQLPDRTLLVSEYSGDRIAFLSPDGNIIKRVGSTGTGDGELIAPQNIFYYKNFFYVIDWGNKRVVKYSADGKFILNFGTPTGYFSGLEGPSGLAVFRNRIYVGDIYKKTIEVFDLSGNHLETIRRDDLLTQPEGISLFPPHNLLIANGSNLLNFNIEKEQMTTFPIKNYAFSHIMQAVLDQNRNLILTDYKQNSLNVAIRSSDLFSTIPLQINRVISDGFPQILVSLTVKDRKGIPLVGLRKDNFIIREGGTIISNHKVLRPTNRKSAALSLVIDSDSSMKNYGQDLKDTVSFLLRNLEKTDQRKYIITGSNPIISFNAVSRLFTTSGKLSFPYTKVPDPGKAVRLAASRLIPPLIGGLKTVLFITSGQSEEKSFKDGDTALNTLGHYMLNNNVRFYAVIFGNQKNKDIEYLAERTGGTVFRQPEDMKNFLSLVKKGRERNYLLSYKSAMKEIDFGRRYIPLNIQVQYLQRFSQDRLGYYPPLQN